MLIDLVYHAVAQPTFVIHGVRKIVQAISWQEQSLPPAKDMLKELGYTSAKMTRLMGVYYNREEVAKAKEKLKQRTGKEHSSVSILMRNQEKTHPQTQGWCIQNIVISETWHRRNRIVTADVFYRSTEVILKFGADLTLLHRVFDELEIAPSPVRFYFANLYISAVFFPLLFSFTNPIKFFEHIRRHDKPFHHLAAKAVSRYLDPTNRYNYRAQAKQWRLAQETVDRTRLDPYLIKHLGEYHEPHLPKVK